MLTLTAEGICHEGSMHVASLLSCFSAVLLMGGALNIQYGLLHCPFACRPLRMHQGQV